MALTEETVQDKIEVVGDLQTRSSKNCNNNQKRW